VVALVSLGAPPAYGQRVKVERTPIVVEHKRFDPANPPPEMPKLGPDDAAITEYRFTCASDIETTVLNQRRVAAAGGNVATSSSRMNRNRSRAGSDEADAGPGCVATVRVESIMLRLGLTATIWLPTDARPKLVNHEEGHRVIIQRIYDEFAEDAARQDAQPWIGKTSSGEGKTCPAAQQAAISKVTADVGQAYMKATGHWARRVGDRYDVLTKHGRRRELAEAEAIDQAFRLEPQVAEEERAKNRR
jgi:hypothetical protein